MKICMNVTCMDMTDQDISHGNIVNIFTSEISIVQTASRIIIIFFALYKISELLTIPFWPYPISSTFPKSREHVNRLQKKI